jgi:ribosomal protein S18 acetylase RimI-like enzyme
MSLPTEPQLWSRDGFIISTDRALLSIPAINHAFNQDFMYWVKAIPEDVLQKIIDGSFCFGLYKFLDGGPDTDPTSHGHNGIAPPLAEREAAKYEQIGFARLITDSVSFAYLTDLYVLPEYQGLGLGGWLINCVDEVLDPLPYLRWVMLRTSVEKIKDSYEKRLGMSVLESGDIREGPVMMGKKGKAGRA